jgi:hypothetical protein
LQLVHSPGHQPQKHKQRGLPTQDEQQPPQDKLTRGLCGTVVGSLDGDDAHVRDLRDVLAGGAALHDNSVAHTNTDPSSDKR